MNSTPTLTFVVIVLVGGDALRRCVERLRASGARIVVVGSRVAGLPDGVAVVDSPDGVPRRRALGAAAAHSEWVAFIEDTCEIDARWHDAFLEIAADARCRAWGGPIEIAPELPPRCAALASLEYGEFAPRRWQRLATSPGPSWRPVRRLAGLCLLYRGDALRRVAGMDQLLLETDVNERLRADGEPIALHAGLAVRYATADWPNARIAARFAHGRIYGGGLAATLDPRRRVLALAKCLALPLLLAVRGAAGLPPRQRQRTATLGWLIGFASAWAAGEAAGLLFGRGDSLAAWR